MSSPATESARRTELLELAYRYVLEHGLTALSLRPLAAAIGSSPRVLLFLFASKDGLVRALLARAREDEMALLDSVQARNAGGVEKRDAGGVEAVTREIWAWLSAPERRGLLVLWTESYAQSLVAPAGPWAGFGADTVNDWLALLADAQPPARRDTQAGAAERTLLLAALRGALLDLLATGDRARTTAAVQLALIQLSSR